MPPVKHPKKSLAVAYILWAIGGIYGWHHLYLKRQSHAYLYSTTLGCLFFGWIRDFWRLRHYVEQANRTPLYVNFIKDQMRQRPESSVYRSLTMYFFSNYLGALFQAPLGFIESPEVVSANGCLAALPFWWVCLSGLLSALGSCMGVIIVGRIDGQRTANYFYVFFCIKCN